MNKKIILFFTLLTCATQTVQPGKLQQGCIDALDFACDHSGKIAALNIASFAAALIAQKAIIQPQIKKLKNKQDKQKTRKLLKAINVLLYAIEAGNVIVTIPTLGLLVMDRNLSRKSLELQESVISTSKTNPITKTKTLLITIENPPVKIYFKGHNSKFDVPLASKKTTLVENIMKQDADVTQILNVAKKQFKTVHNIAFSYEYQQPT